MNVACAISLSLKMERLDFLLILKPLWRIIIREIAKDSLLPSQERN